MTQAAESTLTTNKHVLQWISEMTALTKPDRVVWCDGSEAEKKRLEAEAVSTGEIVALDPHTHPGSFFHRTAENDVARTEHLTFICTPEKADAGPTNNWWAPAEAYQKLTALFDGSMKGRTLYVMPFVMGPLGSKLSKIGIQVTDSIYVVLNMRIMTRMGMAALKMLGDSNDFTRCLHSTADLNIERRYICHFPQDNAIWSIGSGYGGNALLGKKCLALRIGSALGRNEGWLAEHMLIVGIQDPAGKITYVGAAFPSQCGKTNLAMLIPPAALKGYKVWTVGDDIAWIRPNKDGCLYAINPEAGFFGVAPGTNKKSNPNALATVGKNTIFTNVVLTKDKKVWWEGLENPPSEGLDWKGRPWTPSSPEKGAHPNSRFTSPAAQCPTISPEWENPAGVPLSAIIFGGRRAKLAPLVYETLSWQHGTYVGATMASETTSAAMGQSGVVRRDPMAMLPFCGYNMADYWGHWLKMGNTVPAPPKIFHVNWFRTGKDGKFLWPGFGDNLRALLWIIDRVHGKGEAVNTPIGLVPPPNAINIEGAGVTEEAMRELMSVDPAEWRKEIDSQSEFFATFEGRVPKEILAEQNALRQRLG